MLDALRRAKPLSVDGAPPCLAVTRRSRALPPWDTLGRIPSVLHRDKADADCVRRGKAAVERVCTRRSGTGTWREERTKGPMAGQRPNGGRTKAGQMPDIAETKT